jgi:hypothetical protein
MTSVLMEKPGHQLHCRAILVMMPSHTFRGYLVSGSRVCRCIIKATRSEGFIVTAVSFILPLFEPHKQIPQDISLKKTKDKPDDDCHATP